MSDAGVFVIAVVLQSSSRTFSSSQKETLYPDGSQKETLYSDGPRKPLISATPDLSIVGYLLGRILQVCPELLYGWNPHVSSETRFFMSTASLGLLV